MTISPEEIQARLAETYAPPTSNTLGLYIPKAALGMGTNVSKEGSTEPDPSMDVAPTDTRKITRVAGSVHALDIVDAIFPYSPEYMRRRDPNDTRYRAPVFDHINASWKLNKALIARMFKSCYHLSTLTNPDSARDPNSIEEELRFKAVSFGHHPSTLTTGVVIRREELPAEAQGFTAADWAIRFLLVIANGLALRLRSESKKRLLALGERALRDGFIFTEQRDSLSRAAAVQFLREPYSIDVSPETNWRVSQITIDIEKSEAEAMNRQWVGQDGVNPFAGYKFGIPDIAWLDYLPRTACTRCNKMFHLYCPNCRQLCLPSLELVQEHTKTKFEGDATKLKHAMAAYEYLKELHEKPVVLPANIQLVYHPQEKVSKSTGLHGCVLAPSQCQLIRFPDEIPAEGFDEKSTVVLFPTADSKYLDDPEIDVNSIQNVVVVEATWQKAGNVLRHPAIARLRKIRLKERVTTFWRHQELGNQFLATLEAMYYVCVELYERQKFEGYSTPVAPLRGQLAGHNQTSTTMEGQVEVADDVEAFIPRQERRRESTHPTQTNCGAATYHEEKLWKATEAEIALARKKLRIEEDAKDTTEILPSATAAVAPVTTAASTRAVASDTEQTSTDQKGAIPSSPRARPRVGDLAKSVDQTGDRVPEDLAAAAATSATNSGQGISHMYGEEHRYYGEFDDLLLLYAHRYTRVAQGCKEREERAKAKHRVVEVKDEVEEGEEEATPQRYRPKSWRTHDPAMLHEIVDSALRAEKTFLERSKPALHEQENFRQP